MILLGVTGSIAAYKAVEILRLFIKAGEDVHVVLTPAATAFVGPLTFQAISGHPVFLDTLDPKTYQMAHLALAEKASVVLVAPAMHESMWLHPATQTNVKTLKSFGYRFIGPDKGPLGRAGDEGIGRMTEPSAIVQHILRAR